MIARTVFTVLAVTAITCSYGQKSQFDRQDFYAAMASDKMDLVNDQQAIVKASNMTGKQGFEGALLMKKAGLIGKGGEKLSLFKSGHKLLDDAIKTDTSNAELRFLRLMIQEHAPKMLKYKGNIESDSKLIRQKFHQLQPEVQKAVMDYSEKSNILKPTDFNQGPA